MKNDDRLLGHTYFFFYLFYLESYPQGPQRGLLGGCRCLRVLVPRFVHLTGFSEQPHKLLVGVEFGLKLLNIPGVRETDVLLKYH